MIMVEVEKQEVVEKEAVENGSEVLVNRELLEQILEEIKWLKEQVSKC